MKEFDELKTLVSSMEEDVAKAEGGNYQATTRLRKFAQEGKQLFQEIREKCLKLRKEDK